VGRIKKGDKIKEGIGGDDAKELSPVGGDSSLVLRGMGCWETRVRLGG
jgi:hypothetical protein